MNIVRTAFAGAALFITVASTGHSSVDPAPTVTPDTITGVWEALSDRDTRVFRLEITKDSGWLAIGLQYIKPMLFALSRTEWERDRVVLHFVGIGESAHGAHLPDDGTPYSAVLRLSGTAWSQPPACGGLLEGVFVLMPDQQPENAWTVRFIKTCPDEYLDTISKLSIEAKGAIDQQKQAPK